MIMVQHALISMMDVRVLGKQSVWIIPQPGEAGKCPSQALLWDPVRLWLLFGMPDSDLWLLRKAGTFPGPIQGWQSCSTPLSWNVSLGEAGAPREHPPGYLLWISHSWREQSPGWRIPLPEPGRAPGSRFVSRAAAPLSQDQLLLCTRNSPPLPFPLLFPLCSGPFGTGIVFLDSPPFPAWALKGLSENTEIPPKSRMIGRFCPTAI